MVALAAAVMLCCHKQEVPPPSAKPAEAEAAPRDRSTSSNGVSLEGLIVRQGPDFVNLNVFVTNDTSGEIARVTGEVGLVTRSGKQSQFPYDIVQRVGPHDKGVYHLNLGGSYQEDDPVETATFSITRVETP